MPASACVCKGLCSSVFSLGSRVSLLAGASVLFVFCTVCKSVCFCSFLRAASLSLGVLPHGARARERERESARERKRKRARESERERERERERRERGGDKRGREALLHGAAADPCSWLADCHQIGPLRSIALSPLQRPDTPKCTEFIIKTES